MKLPAGALFARGFAADARTERALRTGLDGREAKVQRARFKAALRALAAEAPARMVFVDLDGMPEPGAAARELVAVCPVGTVLVALGADDTARFTRTLLGHGIADYLVKPISAAVVREACAAVSADLPDRAYAGRVATFAGSAGSGVSTLVAAVARAVAGAGRTASVVDLDPDGSALSALLGAEPAGDLPALLADLDPASSGAAAAGDDPAERSAAIAPDGYTPPVAPERLDAVSAAAGDEDAISFVAWPAAGAGEAVREPPSPAAVRALLGHLANRSHVVLATGISEPETRAELMQHADARVLLYEATLPSISVAVRCLALLGKEHSTTLVQSHPRMRRSALSPAQIRYALADRRPDVVIPFDPALHAAATGEGRPRPPGKGYREAVREVLERAVGGVEGTPAKAR